MLSLTGISPIYNSDQNQIIGAVILKKFIGNSSDLAEKITETIGLHAALYEDLRLISKAEPSVKTIEFISPSKPVLESVYQRKQIVSTASFYRGGHLSIHSPILDIDGVPVGILMLQSGVQTFIRGRDTIVTTLIVLLSVGVFLLLYAEKIFDPAGHRPDSFAQGQRRGNWNRSAELVGIDIFALYIKNCLLADPFPYIQGFRRVAVNCMGKIILIQIELVGVGFRKCSSGS